MTHIHADSYREGQRKFVHLLKNSKKAVVSHGQIDFCVSNYLKKTFLGNVLFALFARVQETDISSPVCMFSMKLPPIQQSNVCTLEDKAFILAFKSLFAYLHNILL